VGRPGLTCVSRTGAHGLNRDLHPRAIPALWAASPCFPSEHPLLSVSQSMAAPSPKFQKLLAKLRELFELDKADLDFGLYRVLRARRDEIDKFLREELLPQVQGELGVVTEEKIRPMEAKVEEEIAKVMEYGGKTREEAESSEKVIAAKSLLEQSRNPAALEDEVYSLLATFFGRYYEAGDFISQRRYSGPGKEKYMLPYNGEEVKLVWANMDQYYIKSAENFRDYTFRVPALEPDEPVPVPDLRPRVSFKLIEADTERDNVKAAAAGKRTFAMADPAHYPLELATEDGLSVLRIPFTYTVRDKDDKQDALLAAAEAAVLESANVPDDLKKHLTTKAPTGTRADRTVLAKHLEAYADRNSFDYFIHKDLGGFLTRELDYFLKSELLRVDDLLTYDDHQRTLTLKKARAFLKVAKKIVTFLDRQEQFQKKLWLKKKFVVSTNYVITLDRFPEEFYPEIAANDAQREEWVKLHAIDEIEKDTTTPGYSVPLTVEFLNAHQSLMVDTRNFSAEFKRSLIASHEGVDGQTDGIVIDSENLHSLRALSTRFRDSIECIYIDPPYNTGGDGFAYKDQFQHSSWASFLLDRVAESRNFLHPTDGCLFSSIDDGEQALLRDLIGQAFGHDNFVANVIWQKKYAPANDATWLSDDHDFLIAFARNKPLWSPGRLPRDAAQNKAYSNTDNDPRGDWKAGDYKCNKTADQRPNLYYPITNPTTQKEIWPQRNAVWRYSKEQHDKNVAENLVWWGKDGTNETPAYKRFLTNVGDMVPRTIWKYDEVGHNQDGIRQLRALLPDTNFTSPKPTGFIERAARVGKAQTILDYFAGSGTTAHAVINLNREDSGSRRYILIEMGEHFDTVLVPRIKKVVYSPDWKDGKPATRDKGISHCVKILRLESYEDCLNNLELTRSSDQKDLLSRNPALREDYLLGYFLDVETRGSVLKLDHFRDPWNYRMKIATGSVGETRETPIDMVETFNWLLGLTVQHQSNLQHRRPDKGFAEDEHGRLQLTGGLTRAADPAKDKDSRTFQTIEGKLRSGEKVLVIWRSLTQPQKDEDAARLLEEDNVMLEAFLSRTALNPREKQWDLIYVNGDHTLDNLAERLAEDPTNTAPRFKVRTIEPEFHRLMFEGTED
jgi:adenine-specific DNA-methyltransferase